LLIVVEEKENEKEKGLQEEEEEKGEAAKTGSLQGGLISSIPERAKKKTKL
jgi:hypothetical protein